MAVTLNALPLRRYSKLYRVVLIPGSPVHESVHLDLAAGLLRFVTPILAGQIKLDLRGNEGLESDGGFFIPGDRFFAIIDEYAEVDFDGSVIVTGDGRFDLGALREPYTFPTFQGSLPAHLEISFDGDDSLGKKLAVAAQFAAKDAASENCGVFIRSGRIIGTDRILLYDTKAPDGAADLAIPLSLWQAITSLPSAGVVLSWDAGRIRLETADGELKINAAPSERLAAPDPTEPDFRAAFDHKEVVEVSRRSLIDVLKFFEAFTKQTPFNRLKFGTPAADELLIEVVDVVHASRRIAATVSAGAVADRSHFISSKNLAKALDCASRGDRVLIGVDYDAVTLDVRDEETDTHVVVTVLYE